MVSTGLLVKITKRAVYAIQKKWRIPLYLSALFSDGLKGACSHLNNLFFPQGKNICEYTSLSMRWICLDGQQEHNTTFYVSAWISSMDLNASKKESLALQCVLYVCMSVVHMRYVVNSFSTYLFMLYWWLWLWCELENGKREKISRGGDSPWSWFELHKKIIIKWWIMLYEMHLLLKPSS